MPKCLLKALLSKTGMNRMAGHVYYHMSVVWLQGRAVAPLCISALGQNYVRLLFKLVQRLLCYLVDRIKRKKYVYLSPCGQIDSTPCGVESWLLKIWRQRSTFPVFPLNNCAAFFWQFLYNFYNLHSLSDLPFQEDERSGEKQMSTAIAWTSVAIHVECINELVIWWVHS